MRKQFWSLIIAGFIALNFMACGKKDDNHNPNTPVCTNGYYDSTTGQCINNGIHSGASYNPYINNGRIDGDHESEFRDLVQRTFGRYYRCLYNNAAGAYAYGYADYGCKAIQLQVKKINDSTYQAFLRSPSMLGSNGQYVAGYVYTGTKAVSASLPQGGFAIQIAVGYPYPRQEVEVIVHGDLTQPQTLYQIYFKRRIIASGTMLKGRDY